MKIKESRLGEYHFLEVFTYVDVYNCNELKKIIDAVIELKRDNLAISLHENNEHMDSSVISAMISAHKKVTASGYKFAIIVEKDELVDLLSFAGLKDYFQIYRSAEEVEETAYL